MKNEFSANMVNLPKAFTKEENIKYLLMKKNGNQSARDELILHNMRLVNRVILKNFNNYYLDKEELFSIGLIGLMTAVDKFDVDNSILFTEYAIACIKNIIIDFLKKDNRKRQNEESFEKIFYDNTDNSFITFEKKLEDTKVNIIEDYELSIINQAICQAVNELPEMEKLLIVKYFGFNSEKMMTQKELGDLFGISRSYISKCISKVLFKLHKKLVEQGIFESDITIKRKQYRKV